jgi:hypothetical protein
MLDLHLDSLLSESTNVRYNRIRSTFNLLSFRDHLSLDPSGPNRYTYQFGLDEASSKLLTSIYKPMQSL